MPTRVYSTLPTEFPRWSRGKGPGVVDAISFVYAGRDDSRMEGGGGYGESVSRRGSQTRAMDPRNSGGPVKHCLAAHGECRGARITLPSGGSKN